VEYRHFLGESLPLRHAIWHRLVAGARISFVDNDAREQVRVLGGQPQSDESSPVVPDQRDLARVQGGDQLAHPCDVALVGVVATVERLVRAPEPDRSGVITRCPVAASAVIVSRYI
jgi:hypothetical protein